MRICMLLGLFFLANITSSSEDFLRKREEIKKFQFGKNISAYSEKYQKLFVRPEYSRVSKNTLYSKKAGYGWLKAENLNYRSNGDSRPYYKYGLFNLTRESIWGEKKKTFLIDLPNGKYMVYWLSSFADSGIPTFFDFEIHAEGVIKDKVKIPFQYFVEERIFETEVKDEQLNIDFISENYWWLINALLVFPTGSKEGLEEVRRIRKEIYLGNDEFLSFWKKLEPVIQEKFIPSKEDIERGYIAFNRSWMEDVYPESLPRSNEIMKPINIFMTPGEYEPATFSVRAFKKLKNAKVSVSNLTDKNNNMTIPSSNIDTRIVWCSPHPVGPNKNKPMEKDAQKKSYMIKPDMLVKRKPDQLINVDNDEGVIIEKNETLRYWLTIKADKGLLPGNYTGKVKVSFDNCKGFEVPLSVQILPFTLEMPPDFSLGGWFGSGSETRNLAKILNKKQNRDMPKDDPELLKKLWRHAIERDRLSIKFLKEHNCDMLFLSPEASYTPWNKHKLATELLETQINLAKEFGFIKPIFLGGIEIPGYRERKTVSDSVMQAVTDKAKEEIQEYRKIQKERNWPDFYYYATDEPNDPVRLEKTLKLLKMLKEENVKAAVAAIYPTMKKLDSELHGIKYFCVGYYPSQKLHDEIKKDKNNQYWLYANYNIYYPWRQASRFIHGYYIWKFGFNGYMNCTWNNTWLNPYNELHGRFGDGGATDDAEGPCPVVQWEAAREGVDDLKYIYKLESLIEEAKKSGNLTIKEEAEKAEKALKKFKDGIELEIRKYDFTDRITGQSKFDSPVWKPEYYDQNRKTIANYALKLHSMMHLCKLPENELADGTFKLPEKITTDKEIIERKITNCVYNNEKPTIDGHPGDKVWINAQAMKDFKLLDPIKEVFSQKGISETSKVYITYDDNNLYLCIVCAQKYIGKIKDQISGEKTNFWKSDHIEIFIDPDNDLKTYFQLAVNPAGEVQCYEFQKHNYGREFVRELSGKAQKEIKIKTLAHKSSKWVMELAIPFSLLETQPVKDEGWGFTIGRYHSWKNANSSSCGFFHRPNEFGILMFEK